MKIVFDTDPGIDDAMALMYLNACEDLELLGITTILGNASTQQVTTNACVLCDKFDIRSPVAVYRGAEDALDGTIGDFPDFVHGKNGLGDVPLPVPLTQPADESAVDYLLRITREHPGEITIIAVGRMTNLGLALTEDETFAERVAGIIMMGGAIFEEGNVTRWAEANIIGDPEAAHLVFQSGIPVTLVGLDVTLQTRMSPEYLSSLLGEMGELGEFLVDINKLYTSYNFERYGETSIPIHDSSAIARADQPDLFTIKRGLIECELEGEERGRTLFTEGVEGPHEVCLGVDSAGMLARYRDVVLNRYRQP